jgi:two-component system sensor histidine kinase YesM
LKKGGILRRFYLKEKKYFLNLPLQRKFNIIVCIALIICSIGSLLGLNLIYTTHNRMLYRSMEGTMFHSASLLSEKLKTIESMTTIMLRDSVVQQDLSVAINPDATDLERNNAFRSLSSLVPEYYQNYKQYGISYISLYNSNYTSHSNYARARSLPDELFEALLENAHERPGYAVWNTDYCNSYGLFLSRDVRRADNLELDTIGTIVVNIDLNSVIEDSTKGYQIEDSLLYLIYSNGNELFHSPVLNQEDIPRLMSATTADYGVIRMNGQYFFYTKNLIPDFEWEYICFTPYDSVIRSQRLYLFLSACIIAGIFILSLIFSQKLFGTVTGHFSKLLLKMKCFGENNTQLVSFDYDYKMRHDEIGELHQRFDQMANQVRDLIEKNYVSEILNKEAELKSLENQINPHFLYNTLESINWRAKAVGADEISIMVESLGALLRNTLSRKDHMISTIKTEIDIVKDYMSIIQFRFEEMLQYSIDVPESLYAAPLPKLSLQPLVENAINYALEETTDTCRIEITAVRIENDVLITITNNGSQFPENILQRLADGEAAPHGLGIGLLNIQKRLQLQFGTEYGLTLKNDELYDLAIVELRIPCGDF